VSKIKRNATRRGFPLPVAVKTKGNVTRGEPLPVTFKTKGNMTRRGKTLLVAFVIFVVSMGGAAQPAAAGMRCQI